MISNSNYSANTIHSPIYSMASTFYCLSIQLVSIISPLKTRDFTPFFEILGISIKLLLGFTFEILGISQI